METNIIKRVTKKGFVFIDKDRHNLKSSYFKTREERDVAIEAYLIKRTQLDKAYEERMRIEKDLTKA